MPDDTKAPSSYVMVTTSGTDNLWNGVTPRVRAVFADNRSEVYEVSRLDDLNMGDVKAVKAAFDNNAAAGLYRYVLLNGRIQLYSAEKLADPGSYAPSDGVLTAGGQRYWADEDSVIYVRTKDAYRAYTLDELGSPVRGLDGSQAWVASESWGGRVMVRAAVLTAEYLPSPSPMSQIKNAYVLDYPASQFDAESESWFLTLTVLMDGSVRTISALPGVKVNGTIGLGSYGGVSKGELPAADPHRRRRPDRPYGKAGPDRKNSHRRPCRRRVCRHGGTRVGQLAHLLSPKRKTACDAPCGRGVPHRAGRPPGKRVCTGGGPGAGRGCIQRDRSGGEPKDLRDLCQRRQYVEIISPPQPCPALRGLFIRLLKRLLRRFCSHEAQGANSMFLNDSLWRKMTFFRTTGKFTGRILKFSKNLKTIVLRKITIWFPLLTHPV